MGGPKALTGRHRWLMQPARRLETLARHLTAAPADSTPKMAAVAAAAAAPTRSPITTHVLDTTLGRPAQRVPITLEVRGADGSWSTVGSGMTDDDGRLPTLLTP